MGIRLVILGLLMEKPLYGYELKQIIEERMGDWTDIKFGSIYFALAKLEEEDYLEKIAEEKDTKRPARQVFKITIKGRDEFYKLLRSGWKLEKRQYNPLDILLYFANCLPKEELKILLDEKIKWYEKAIEHLAEHKDITRHGMNLPEVAYIIMNHSLVHFKAELEWLYDVRKKIDLLYRNNE